MKKEKAIEILKNMNDGFTFRNCSVCIEDNKYDEKDGICKSKTCEYLKAIETVLADREDWKKSHDYMFEAYQDIGKQFFELSENCISKQKIRDKIEEKQKILDVFTDEMNNAIQEKNQNKFDLYNKGTDNMSLEIQVLNELLESEE